MGDIDETLKTLDASVEQFEALLGLPLASQSDEALEVPDDAAPAARSGLLELNLFKKLAEVQSAHGIPLQDYAQYYAYCTKRLHRIRHHKDVRSQLVHSNKYKKQHQAQPGSAQGGGANKKEGSKTGRHAFCPRPPIPEDGQIRHEYILWNLVFQAERAWALACSLQASENIPDNNNKGRVKAKHKSNILSRLNKAVHWARILEDAVSKQENVPPRLHREVNSYLMWMLGNQQLQRKEYAAAFRFYNTSRSILLELAKSTSQESNWNQETEVSAVYIDAEKLALQDIWTNRADNLLLPLIRFCQYEAKDEDLVQEEGDQDGAGPESPKRKGDTIALEFRGREISLDSYPALAVLYLKLEKRLALPALAAENKRKSMSEDDFLQFLSDLDDALRWTVQEAQRYDSLPDGPAVLARRRELASLKAFFQYHKLSLQRQHQEERLEEIPSTFTADPAEMLHVYESLLQNAQAMVDLNQEQQQLQPGGGNNVLDDAAAAENTYNPEDDPYWLEAQAHVVRIRALRCFHLARIYESPLYLAGSSTSAQVLALLQQCSRLQRRAVEEVAACDFVNPADGDVYQQQLDHLLVHIQAGMARVKAARFLEQQQQEQESSSVASKATGRPLWLRLHDLDAGPVLVEKEPLLIPLPCKPVFYDVAWELVTDNTQSRQNLNDFIQLHDAPKAKKSYGGFLGWFSS